MGAMPTINFEELTGKVHELPAQTECWPAPADLDRADLAPIVATAEDGRMQPLYRSTAGGYLPLHRQPELLAEQVQDALVLAVLPQRYVVCPGFVKGVAGPRRELPLIARGEPLPGQRPMLRLHEGYGWMVKGPGPHLAANAVVLAQDNSATLVLTDYPLAPRVTSGLEVQPHVPPQARVELDRAGVQVVALRALEDAVERCGVRQQRWAWAVYR